MDAVERETGADGFGVFLVNFGPVDIEHDRENEDERPIEIFRASDSDAVDQISGRLRSVAPEYKHDQPSSLLTFWQARRLR